MKTLVKVAVGIFSILILYSLVGFFLVPYLLRQQIEKQTESRLGTRAQVEKISFNPFTFRLSLEKFKLPAMQNESVESETRLSFEKFTLNFTVYPLLQKQIRFKSVEIDSANALFEVFKNGTINWTLKNDSTSKEDSTQNLNDWVLTLDSVKVINSRIDFRDYTHAKPLELPLGPVSVTASHISTSINSTTSLNSLTLSIGDKGVLTLKGDLTLKPLFAKVEIDAQELPMDSLTAYLSDKTYLQVQQGRVYAKGEILYQNGKLLLTGDSEVLNFSLAREGEDSSILSWERLALADIQVSTAPLDVKISEVEVVAPKSSVILRKDGTLNFKALLKPIAQDKSPEDFQPLDAQGTEVKGMPFSYLIKKVTLMDGELDYSDQQIRPQFTAHIHDFHGVVGPISSDRKDKINLTLAGRVEEFGKFNGSGYVVIGENRPSLEVSMGFHNIELTTFTPYAGRFAGYEIQKGKMFLDFKYKLVNNRIKGTNKVLLDQFRLGNKVQSEKAKHIPVKFALALLRDRHGQINFQLPVEGDVNSPSFSVGGIVWTAIKNLMVKIVMFPFDVIAGLVGGSDLQQILFEPGSDQLMAGESEKIEKMAHAMEERPQLALGIQGTYASKDIEALQEKVFDEKLEPYLKSNRGDRNKAVQSMAKTFLKGDPSIENKSVELDQQQELESKIKAELVIPHEDLKALGLIRGRTIMSLFSQKKVDPERMFLLAAKEEKEGLPQVELKAQAH